MSAHNDISSSDDDDDDDDAVIAPISTSISGDTRSLSNSRNRISPLPIRHAISPPVSSMRGDRHRPRGLSLDELAMRPRSNPRTRTPLRNASPLASSFSRFTLRDDDEEQEDEDGIEALVSSIAVSSGGSSPQRQQQQQQHRLRIGAGSAAGTQQSRGGTISTAGSSSTTGLSTSSNVGPRVQQQQRSSKQGPSRRKLRRWNNDNFVGISADIARSSKRGAIMAEVFARGEAEAMAFLRANHPLNYKSVFAEMVDESNTSVEMMQIRERFLKGEVAPKHTNASNHHNKAKYTNGNTMFHDHIQERLRKVILRTCSNNNTESNTNTFAVRILDAFEVFLITSFRSNSSSQIKKPTSSSLEEMQRDASQLLNQILVHPPTLTTLDQQNKSTSSSKPVLRIKFVFDDNAHPKSAFYRLLLHAVCQFHGLSSTTSNAASSSKMCLVTGKKCHGSKFRLVDYAQNHVYAADDNDDDGNQFSAAPAVLENPADTTESVPNSTGNHHEENGSNTASSSLLLNVEYKQPHVVEHRPSSHFPWRCEGAK